MSLVNESKKAEYKLGFFGFKGTAYILYKFFLLTVFSLVQPTFTFAADQYSQPNIVIILSDDQSWKHTSKAGYPYIKTPNFDKIANEGVYFEHTYVTAPSCAPSRVGILSGLYPWQTESAALLYSVWPDDIQSFPIILEANGYTVGHTGKGAHSSRPASSRRLPQLLGKQFNQIKRNPPDKNLTHWDLAKNFNTFLKQREQSKPFMFWIGSLEPHRPYDDAINDYFTKVKTQADFLPLDYPHDRSRLVDDFARYLQEIEVFDDDVGRVTKLLEDKGLLENTVIVVTADNGMPFPKAKAQNYEYGVRVPLAIRWGSGIKSPNRTVTSMISLIDLAPTFLELAGIDVPKQMQGKSLAPLLLTNEAINEDKSREYVFSAYERHSNWRSDKDPTYPRRIIHTRRYSLIRNYFPDRWPSGGPPVYGETYRYFLSSSEHKKDFPVKWASFVFDKRPYEELYDLRNDPFQFNNIIDDPEYVDVKESLQKLLDGELTKSGDPVHLTGEDYFAQFPRLDSALDDFIAEEKRLAKRKPIQYLLREQYKDAQ